jgi:glutamate-ammonia-ligase adenylyltransferase
MIQYTEVEMDTTSLIKRLQGAYPEINPDIIQDFVSRMDPDYFAHFGDHQMGEHLQLANALAPDHPCALHIRKKKDNSYQLSLVAYDYFSEFATICGILSAFGLDIREAFIFTYIDTPSPSQVSRKQQLRFPRMHLPPFKKSFRPSSVPILSRKKVVDVFQLQVLPDFPFGKKQQNQLKAELMAVIQLLDDNQVRQARSQVNRKLVETLGKLQSKETDFIHPVQIRFNNSLAVNETVMDIQSIDTPAFLFAFANALTMRGIYLAKAIIEVEANKVRNRFFVRGRHGKKIEGQTEQQELTAAAAFIKEFTHFLTWAPDPAKALEHFDQLLDELFHEDQTGTELSVLTQKPLLAHLAQLFGTSDYLWEDFLRRQHANLLPVMENLLEGSLIRTKDDLAKSLRSAIGKIKDTETRKTRLNQFKDQELFRIDMKHLVENSPLPEFSKALTHLAEVILQQACLEAQTVVNREFRVPRLVNDQPVPFAICGLGKLGGQELGYASDIEVLFVYGIGHKASTEATAEAGEYFERLVQEILRWVEAKQEGIFRIDTRLRPHGEQGLLATSLKELQDYYSPSGGAAPFERQAWIKLRAVAGDAALGRKVEKHRIRFVFNEIPWPLDTALHLRQRQIKELVPPGTTHVKYSPGGLIDVEYTVQYLQIIHGHKLPALHTSNTLQALEALQQTGLLDKDDSKILRHDYLFLRQLIDALRIVRGNAQDLVLPPSKSDGMIFLARRLGFITEDWQEGAEALEREIHDHMKRTHGIFVKHFEELNQ